MRNSPKRGHVIVNPQTREVELANISLGKKGFESVALYYTNKNGDVMVDITDGGEMVLSEFLESIKRSN